MADPAASTGAAVEGADQLVVAAAAVVAAVVAVVVAVVAAVAAAVAVVVMVCRCHRDVEVGEQSDSWSRTLRTEPQVCCSHS